MFPTIYSCIILFLQVIHSDSRKKKRNSGQVLIPKFRRIFASNVIRASLGCVAYWSNGLFDNARWSWWSPSAFHQPVSSMEIVIKRPKKGSTSSVRLGVTAPQRHRAQATNDPNFGQASEDPNVTSTLCKIPLPFFSVVIWLNHLKTIDYM